MGDLQRPRGRRNDAGGRASDGVLRGVGMRARVDPMSGGRLRVLFLCTGNSARSQMGEAILRHLAEGAVDVQSAGSDPKPEIHALARSAVQKLLGLDMAGQRPKSMNRFLSERFDYVITVCDHAAEVCPAFPGAQIVHWSLPDPAGTGGSEEERR